MSDVIQITLKINAANSTQKPSRLLAESSGLSHQTIKDAMQKGAVWLCRGRTKKRLRRVNKALQLNDELVLNYDPEILNQQVPTPELVHDQGDYSIWFKPYGLYCQGSRWGDFASIDRWVETHMASLVGGSQRPVFLVHRLDRATSGLMLLCHSKKAARLFSQKFADGQVDKRYQAIIQGDFSTFPAQVTVEQPIDGKASVSLFSCVKVKNDQSLLDVVLKTGRKHQIRKHLRHLGYPIVGDRLYGQVNENDPDLQLQSVGLSFECPFSKEQQAFVLDSAKRLRLP